MATPRFDNRFVRAMPADPRDDLGLRKVRDALYSRVTPTRVRAPRVLAWSADVARTLGFAALDRDAAQAAGLGEVFAGNTLLPGSEPHATRYGGHQFGNWAGQLGDGRAISLGEVACPDGTHLELQLKGAGPTPYSRRADGRAVLRSSLREYLCSEAMHALGVPTTRALSLVATGEQVERDMFYDGHPQLEPGAVVCRVAPSFVRLGHFELLAADDEVELLGRLLEHVVTHHGVGTAADARDPRAVLGFLEDVAMRTGRLVAEWQRVGFVHGVMNTDNLSILGVTIDYGPYGFVEPYEPHFTPNTTDAHGRRYRYGNQPAVAMWNLSRFAEALAPLLTRSMPVAEAQAALIAVLERAGDALATEVRAGYGRKFGLVAGPEDDTLLPELLAALGRAQADFTLSFRALTSFATHGDRGRAVADLTACTEAEDARAQAEVTSLLDALVARWGLDAAAPAERAARMAAANPVRVPRNWLVQEAIDAAAGDDLAPLDRLLVAFATPYVDDPQFADLARKRPAWARQKAGCSMLSCSS